MVQLCRVNPARSRFCEDSLKCTLYLPVKTIQFLENQMNYIFSQKTLVSLVTQTSCNQGHLKSLTKPE